MMIKQIKLFFKESSSTTHLWSEIVWFFIIQDGKCLLMPVILYNVAPSVSAVNQWFQDIKDWTQ